MTENSPVLRNTMESGSLYVPNSGLSMTTLTERVMKIPSKGPYTKNNYIPIHVPIKNRKVLRIVVIRSLEHPGSASRTRLFKLMSAPEPQSFQ